MNGRTPKAVRIEIGPGFAVPFTLAEYRDPAGLNQTWVMHEVMPFQGDGKRITVTFNAWFRQKQPGKSAGDSA